MVILKNIKKKGAAFVSALFFVKFKKVIMSDKDQKKTEIPHRMSRIAWPNAKYGLFLAIIIIILFLLISYRHLIF